VEAVDSEVALVVLDYVSVIFCGGEVDDGLRRFMAFTVVVAATEFPSPNSSNGRLVVLNFGETPATSCDRSGPLQMGKKNEATRLIKGNDME
jgi:hypothetical protein